MEVEVSWCIEGRVLLLKYRGVVTSEDVNEVGDNETLPRLNAAQQPIHLLIDVSELPSIDISIKESIQDPRTEARLTHPMMGCLVYVTENNTHYFHLMASYVTKRYGKKTHVVSSQAAALEFLYQVDPSLSEDS